MQTVIAQPALTAQARIVDLRFVAKKFPLKHGLDHLLDAMLPENTSYKIEKSTFESIIF